MTLVDDENVAFECIGEKLRQLGLVTESAADVERSLLGTDTRFDDHPVGEEHSLDDSPGGSGCRGVGDCSEQRRSGLGEPQRPALWPSVRNEHGRIGHLVGPGLKNLDFSLFRKFSFTEQTVLEIRGETFNLSNTPHFNNPGGTFGASNFGMITTAQADSRVVQIGAKIRF